MRPGSVDFRNFFFFNLYCFHFLKFLFKTISFYFIKKNLLEQYYFRIDVIKTLALNQMRQLCFETNHILAPTKSIKETWNVEGVHFLILLFILHLILLIIYIGTPVSFVLIVFLELDPFIYQIHLSNCKKKTPKWGISFYVKGGFEGDDAQKRGSKRAPFPFFLRHRLWSAESQGSVIFFFFTWLRLLLQQPLLKKNTMCSLVSEERTLVFVLSATSMLLWSGNKSQPSSITNLTEGKKFLHPFWKQLKIPSFLSLFSLTTMRLPNGAWRNLQKFLNARKLKGRWLYPFSIGLIHLMLGIKLEVLPMHLLGMTSYWRRRWKRCSTGERPWGRQPIYLGGIHITLSKLLLSWISTWAFIFWNSSVFWQLHIWFIFLKNHF